ncbi:hypothetical protein DUNSADRAFT_2459 [Dunaliella salina]|uniref:EF-hand domain-containing protein n=1 Tax=Dunaliella salina TaxID=3046 RepID=A0ABQ7FWD0_DUNSA|nr:hypothetical protein DUNSADRAFT_2459 [Dunaliella salina]|eukprot:KAF5826642.1 hypothetical protein DUNSADRAFT_2459 [Dunaliella salina]
MAERERKPGVTIAKEEADETASEVETRRGAFHVSAITKGFSGTLRRRVESLDKDGDGTIDLLELQETLKADYRTHKANKQLKVIILFIFGTLLLSIGATCGTTYAMVSFLKDSEVSDEGVLRSTKSHGPVRTGAARGSVSTSRVDIGAASTAGVRLRRLHQSGNITEAERAPCLNDCPVASTSCTQANKWFDMLKEDTTESDVMFKVSTYKTNIVKVRAYEWSVRPATILGYDTDHLGEIRLLHILSTVRPRSSQSLIRTALAWLLRAKLLQSNQPATINLLPRTLLQHGVCLQASCHQIKITPWLPLMVTWSCLHWDL